MTGYVAGPLFEAWGLSITGVYHRQSRNDLDEDDWSDMAGYERGTLRPRLFWEGAQGASAYITVGAMTEQRVGGTLEGSTPPDRIRSRRRRILIGSTPG